MTNVSEALLSLDEALVLLLARWQIELLFKLFKSQGQVDVSRSQNPWRVLCEVYARLLALLVQHWLFVCCCWQYPQRSLGKASQTLARLALSLAAAFGSRQVLLAMIAVLARCLACGCRMNRRKARPNTCQLLDNPPPLGGLA